MAHLENGLGDEEGVQTEAAISTRVPLMAKVGAYRRVQQSCGCRCSACHLKDSPQRQKAKKSCQKNNRRIRYWCHFLRNCHSSLAGVLKCLALVKAQLSTCLPKTVYNSSLAFPLPPTSHLFPATFLLILQKPDSVFIVFFAL